MPEKSQSKLAFFFSYFSLFHQITIQARKYTWLNLVLGGGCKHNYLLCKSTKLDTLGENREGEVQMTAVLSIWKVI